MFFAGFIAIIKQYGKGGVLCMKNLRKCIFSVGGLHSAVMEPFWTEAGARFGSCLWNRQFKH